MSAASFLAHAPTHQSGDNLGGSGDFQVEAGDFERVRSLIRARAGISLHAGKQAMVYSRLSRRLRDTGHRSFGSYLEWLDAASGSAGEGARQGFVNSPAT